MMEFDAEFFVLLGFLVFVGVLIYFGAHRIVLKALDARGEAIAAELAQAAKLRQEATALLASFEKSLLKPRRTPPPLSLKRARKPSS